MTIRTSSLSGGGGGGFKLAPDLSYISNNRTSAEGYQEVIIDPSAGLTTAISLTGKFAVSSMGVSNTTAESFTIKLTIDSVVIINDTFTASSSGISILNAVNGTAQSSVAYNGIGAIVCESSLLLEVQSTTDTSVNVNFVARPIL